MLRSALLALMAELVTAASRASLMGGMRAAGIATPDGSDPTDDISEKAKAGVDNVVEGVKDAVKKVSGSD
jgi:hypothetical protein